VRIIAGRHRGLKLADVGAGDPAAHLRPTSDRVREAIFNLLLGGRFGDPVTGARVLDLFAGTGALGLEALSRGAAHVTFVDDGRVAQGLIRANLRLAGREADATVPGQPVARLGPGAPCGLIFLDPPYGRDLGAGALQAAMKGGWVAPQAVAVWEESRPVVPPPSWALLDQRRYGDTWVTILQFTPG
jgi:16S rRNA (guanine966-N2)-methyltransferase